MILTAYIHPQRFRLPLFTSTCMLTVNFQTLFTFPYPRRFRLSCTALLLSTIALHSFVNNPYAHHACSSSIRSPSCSSSSVLKSPVRRLNPPHVSQIRSLDIHDCLCFVLTSETMRRKRQRRIKRKGKTCKFSSSRLPEGYFWLPTSSLPSLSSRMQTRSFFHLSVFVTSD